MNDFEVIIAAHVDHLVCRQIRHYQSALVKEQHANPRNRQAVQSGQQREQWIAHEEIKDPTPE